MRIVIDLETMGTSPGSVITALGAVKFGNVSTVGDVVLSKFYERIDWQSCLDWGLKIDADTIKWWLSERVSQPARNEIIKPGKPLHKVLQEFNNWCGFRTDPQPEPVAAEAEIKQIWGNGAAFDNALLSFGYSVTRIPRPWTYKADRCYRTFAAQFPAMPIKRSGTHHNAVDDAEDEARHIIELEKLGARS